MQSADADTDRERRSLVSRLSEQGILDARVLAAMARVPRAAFVPAEQRERAEEDRALEIGCGQTISQPFIVAAMTSALQLTGRERVLEIGTGSGYQTAVLAEILPLQAVLRTIERHAELLAGAARTLGALGYRNIEYRCGDGSRGWPEAAPFDAILVAAAAPEVPPALLDQLALGGRLVLPVGSEPSQQDLQLWVRKPDGEFRWTSLLPVRFVPLISDQDDEDG